MYGLYSWLLALAVADIPAKLTFYGAKDNCPPGAQIAYPKIHKLAGGVGSYDDPITFAGAKTALDPGIRIYARKFNKYFIFEDDCEECRIDWEKETMYHFDLWMGPVNATAGKGLIECENQLSDDKASSSVMLNPAPGLPVDLTPFFDTSRAQYDGCIVKADPCTDVGNKCGNSCEIPKPMTCPQLANLFVLTLDRFKALNPKLDCGGTIPAGKSVCQGGTCGD